MSMAMLPGSAGFVGGPLECTLHVLGAEDATALREWRFESVYANVPGERPRLDEADRPRLLRALRALKCDADSAARALLDGDHLSGHPLPGVYTVGESRSRIDFRVKDHAGSKHLWALLYRT